MDGFALTQFLFEENSHELYVTHRFIARAFSPSETALLSNALYWIRPDSQGNPKVPFSNDGHQWIIKTRQAWCEDTNLTIPTLDRVLKSLRDAEIIATKSKVHQGMKKLYLRVDCSVLAAKLGIECSEVPSDNTETIKMIGCEKQTIKMIAPNYQNDRMSYILKTKKETTSSSSNTYSGDEGEGMGLANAPHRDTTDTDGLTVPSILGKLRYRIDGAVYEFNPTDGLAIACMGKTDQDILNAYLAYLHRESVGEGNPKLQIKYPESVLAKMIASKERPPQGFISRLREEMGERTGIGVEAPPRAVQIPLSTWRKVITKWVETGRIFYGDCSEADYAMGFWYCQVNEEDKFPKQVDIGEEPEGIKDV